MRTSKQARIIEAVKKLHVWAIMVGEDEANNRAYPDSAKYVEQLLVSRRVVRETISTLKTLGIDLNA